MTVEVRRGDRKDQYGRIRDDLEAELHQEKSKLGSCRDLPRTIDL